MYRQEIKINNGAVIARIIKDRSSLTPRQKQRIGEELVKGLNGPDSLLPRKGGGVRGQATGKSRRSWKSQVLANGQISLINTATTRGHVRYFKYPEAGYPNPKTRGRAAKTIRRIWPKVIRRVLR